MINRILARPLPQLDSLMHGARSYALHAMAVGACAVLGIALGFVKSGTLENASAPKDVWKLPQIVARTAAPAMSPEDVADLFWSEEPRAKRVVVQKGPANNWRFIGTYAQGEQLYAIIADDKRVQTLKTGDVLPDGAVIQSVQDGLLNFEQDGSTKLRRLYDKGALQ